MKKFAAALLAFALLISSAVGWAESETTQDTGIWEKRAYVDEFDLPTDEYYISNAEPIVGKFSNSATTDSELLTYIYIDKGVNYNDISLSFKLIEYGNNVVKNAYSRSLEYDVAMMDGDEEKYYFSAFMPSGKDQIYVDAEECMTVLTALCGPGTIRFVFTEKENPTSKYSFIIEDSSGLGDLLPAKNTGIFSDGMCQFWNIMNLHGYINTSGEIVIPCIYSTAYDFCAGIAPVCKDDQWGVIDTNGEVVIPFGEYESIGKFKDGMSVVKKDGKFGYIDSTGALVIPCEFDAAYDFGDGLACVYSVENRMCGYIDKTGTLVIPTFGYGDGYYFEDGLAPDYDWLKQKYGCIDKTGERVIPAEFDNIYGFSDGLSYAIKDGQRCYIDKTGQIVITGYDGGTFSEGLAPVEDGDKYGYIDTNGEIVLPFQYDHAGSFNEGVAVFITKGRNGFEDGKQGVIDRTGDIIIPCEYDAITYNEGYFSLIKDGDITVVSRDELQPGWKEELAEQEEARKAEAEAQRMLMEYTDKETIQSVQTALNEAGYDCGTPDGIAGKNTQAAISAFQKDNSLNETGTATHELLLALGIIEE